MNYIRRRMFSTLPELVTEFRKSVDELKKANVIREELDKTMKDLNKFKIEHVIVFDGLIFNAMILGGFGYVLYDWSKDNELRRDEKIKSYRA